MTSRTNRASATNVRAVAHQTWLMLHTMARNKDASHTRWSQRDGYTLKLPGPLGMSIRFASARVTGSSRHGNTSTNEIIGHLRRYGNVAALGGDRVFVALTYNDIQPIIEHTQFRSPRRHDDIPEREAGPVTTTNLWEEFSKTPIGPKAAEVLKILHEHGGSIVDEDGFTSTQYGLNSAGLKSARDRKLVVTRQANARRFASIALTTRGRWAVEHLSMVQYADVAVAAFLARRGGSYTGSSPKRTTSEIGEELRMTKHSVGRALLELEQQGVVERTWSPGHVSDDSGGVVASARLTGKEIPGVHIETVQQNGEKEEPEEDDVIIHAQVRPELGPEPEEGQTEPQWDDNAVARSVEEVDRVKEGALYTDQEQVREATLLSAQHLIELVQQDMVRQHEDSLMKIRSVIAACNAGTVTPMKALSTIEELIR